jgi:predicted dehydrogenase/threonine dehydrogenase-like Zn-dependent dehydrogenase
MKQILQDNSSGEVSVHEVPSPSVQRGRILVRNVASVISAGTEKIAVDTGKQSLLKRAKERPDLVKQVIDKVRTEGLASTYAAVKGKLDAKTALGYSSAGIVTAIGEGVSGFSVGDRVACAGAGYASHAEIVSVPQNLCVQLPDSVSFEEGAFATLGAIALQGVRLAAPTLGESVVVMGLGLLGQITVQLLRANGCRVFGIDLDESKFALAQELGADECSTPDDAPSMISTWSHGRGADAVLITAGTPSNEPVRLAGEISRSKGRVVVVGMVGMDVPRGPYFSKELSLQISMSYGPGRYDPMYEERGHDYPVGHVRWTEGRNLEAFLDLIADESILLEPLISHRFEIDSGEDAYKLISGKANEPYLGIVLKYDLGSTAATRVPLPVHSSKESNVRVGLIGAGGYAVGMLLPHLKTNGVEFRSIATSSGLSARNVGRQFGFAEAVSSADEVIGDASVNLIVIATRHGNHSELAKQALDAGRHVFVEKPLALNDEELNAVIETAKGSSGTLNVGFNRRFSPLAVAAREFIGDEPISILYRVNAGRIPKDSWIQDPTEGGGRIIGEVCHFIDLMHYLAGSVTTRVYAESLTTTNAAAIGEDSVFITLKFADGSNGTIAYLAEGDKSLSKERIEIFGGGRSYVIDDFKTGIAYANGKETTKNLRSQDKGQAAEIKAVCSVVKGETSAPIALDDLAATTRATFRILESLRSGSPIDV